jgi:CubicO group peptidase (beta-lactamase class C family)
MKTARLLALALLCAQTLFAQMVVTAHKIVRIDSFLTVLEQNHLFNGSVLVAEEGKVIYKRSVGYANRERGIANTENTCFNLASASKPFTSLAVLQLAEKRELKLDDPLVKYFPDLPYPAITIRHLLSQTSGLPVLERYEDDYVKAHRDEIISPAKAYADLVSLKQPLSFQPGDNWSYNNLNYLLLAMLVERVSQLPFPEYMWKNIFSKAGMTSTYIRGAHAANTSRYILPAMYDSVYQDVDSLDHIKNNTYYNLGGMPGPGNVISTTEDLFRFDNALNEGKLISPGFFKQMWAPVVLNNGKTFHLRKGSRSYGLGWSVMDEPGKDTVVFHDGHIVGLITIIYKDRTKKHTTIMYDNMEHTSGFFQEVGTISRILTDQPLNKMELRQSLARAYGQFLAGHGMEDAMIRFNEMKTDTAHYYFEEQEMNTLGYDLLSKAAFPGHIAMAEEVFKINVLLYPDHYNVYDSYADALLKNGKKEAAMAMYEESIRRDPDHHGGQSAAAMKLGEKRQGSR